MLIKAEQKFIRTSARKLRQVARGVRGAKSPQDAITVLGYTPQRASVVVSKVIKQALGNAKNNLNLPEDGLKIKELVVGEGPTYKRGRAVSRGRFAPIMKRTSHVRVVLESEEEVTRNSLTRDSKNKQVTTLRGNESPKGKHGSKS